MSAIARKVASTSRVAGEGRTAALAARARSSRSAASKTAECCRTSIVGQVEPERLHLPAQVLELAPREARGAPPASSERCSTSMSRDELLRAVVGAAASPERVAASRCAARPSLRRCGASGSLRAELASGTREATARREPAPGAAPGSRGDVAFAETESVRAMRRVAASSPRSTWSVAIAEAVAVTSAVTRGIAVPVAADPRAPPQERRERRCRHAAPLRVERPIHLAVHGRQGGEDRLVEQGEHRAHLVERLGPMMTDRVGVPESGDLLARGAACVSDRLGRAERGSSSRSSRSPDAPDRCSTTARRFASVGCAVSTGRIRRSPNASGVERRAPRSSPCGWPDAVRPARSTLIRWRSSARFTSWK